MVYAIESRGQPGPSRLNGYQLRLPNYEGPLDVLLRLIERDQLAITEVSLVAVTDQFIAYAASLGDVPAELVAEFTVVGARLVALKSRSLLPAPAKEESEADPDDLTLQLRAYAAVKQVAGEIAGRERAGVRSWRRLGARPALPERERLVPIPADGLLGALRRCARRSPAPPERLTPLPVVTLAAMTRRILGRLGARRARYSALIGESAGRSEMAVGFLAILSLLRARIISASQPALFGEIEIERVQPVPIPADD